MQYDDVVKQMKSCLVDTVWSMYEEWCSIYVKKLDIMQQHADDLDYKMNFVDGEEMDELHAEFEDIYEQIRMYTRLVGECNRMVIDLHWNYEKHIYYEYDHMQWENEGLWEELVL
jgi:hypothetical protein